MQTANFVRQEGGQLELVLRVRQAQNASFGFLKPDSPLHDYYRWLVHAKPQVPDSAQSQHSNGQFHEARDLLQGPPLITFRFCKSCKHTLRVHGTACILQELDVTAQQQPNRVRSLLQMPMQAREMIRGPSVNLEANSAVAAAAQEQHEILEAGGALSHLVSMYGASQDASHDDSDDESTNPHVDTGQANALQTGNNPTLAPGAQRAEAAPDKESVAHEEGLQPEKAAPAHGSAEQEEHGSRGGAESGYFDAAQQPAQSAQQAHHADLPPAESQGIILKLMAFVKVRPSLLVPLWRCESWSCGAHMDDRRMIAGGSWMLLC